MSARVSLPVWVAVALVFAAAVVLPLWLACDGSTSVPDGLAAGAGFKDQGPACGERTLSGSCGGGPVVFLSAPPPLPVDEAAVASTALADRDPMRAPAHVAASVARLL